VIKLIPNKAIIDIRLCPRCALPSPHSRPIGRIACTQNFPNSYLCLPGILNDPFCCMTLLAIEWSLLQRTRQRRYCTFYVFHQSCPFPLRDGVLRLTQSLSQTAPRSVQPFSYGSQMLYCTMHCQWGRKPTKLPFPLGFRHPAGGGPMHAHRQHGHAQKNW